jgi:hypothetical protein
MGKEFLMTNPYYVRNRFNMGQWKEPQWLSDPWYKPEPKPRRWRIYLVICLIMAGLAGIAFGLASIPWQASWFTPEQPTYVHGVIYVPPVHEDPIDPVIHVGGVK